MPELLRHSIPRVLTSGKAMSKVPAVPCVSRDATLVTGGDVERITPLAADNELVTTVVGPGNTGVFRQPAQTRTLNPGDVVVIPAGVYHGFSEIPDHLDYVAVRPDVEKVLPAGYVNPALKR